MGFPWLRGVTNHLQVLGWSSKWGGCFFFKAWYLEAYSPYLLCSEGVFFIFFPVFLDPSYLCNQCWLAIFKRDVDLKMSQRFNKWFVTGLWRFMGPYKWPKNKGATGVRTMELKGQLWCVCFDVWREMDSHEMKNHPWRNTPMDPRIRC